MKQKTSSERYNFIDVIRGAAIISMVIYHLCYDIFQVYGVDTTFYRRPMVMQWEHTICMTFIIVSAISLHFSHHPWRRGIMINLCGFAVTIVTVLVMPSEQIWFGVLNLIGCAMLITHALRGLLDRLPPIVGMTGFGLLYLLTYGVPKGFLGIGSIQLIELPKFLYGCKYLAFLGFPSKDFHSSDFFPLLPWLFLYFFGYLLWRLICERGRDGRFRRDIRPLSFIGRHSLWIYLAHQPILYLICAAIFGRF